jgi:glycosyltransferase involved in cell wall biosynthesis
LVPALRPFCKVELQEGWVGDLGELFLQSKIFLYDSSQHWMTIGASEGFGLPPIEALASGCIIFSSVNDALADFLDPGVNCHKIRTYSVEYDVAMILKSLETGLPRIDPTSFMQQLRTNSIVNKLKAAIEDAEQFFVLSKGRCSIISNPASYAPSPSKRSLANRLLGWAARV